MSDLRASSEDCTLPLFTGEASRPIAWRDGRTVTLLEFGRHVAALASRLPATGAMINLCGDRYKFIAAYAAALSRGHAVLLPSARVEQVVCEIQEANHGSYRIDDASIDVASMNAPAHDRAPRVAPEDIVMVGYTSGSTGRPQGHAKRWSSVNASTARNAAKIRDALASLADQSLWLVATVPPQHMYGMESSILLPLLDRMAVHAGRPLFPADVARALGEIPAPRVLISTPVHLRALVDSSQAFPQVTLVVSATAPLDQALARAVEAKLGAPLLEMFGSTETCVIATRRTAIQARWQLYEGVSLQPSEEGTLVDAPWFTESVLLQDVIELHGQHEFVVRGRNADMIEVAGKRASLSDLTRRVLAIEGVKDAAVFQPDAAASGSICRVAAFVVAPTLTAKQVVDALAASVDPAFLPRPLIFVDSLPRNDLGKLPRDKLVEMLRKRIADGG